MRHQHRLGALQMRIARHHRIAGLARLLNQRRGPRREPFDDRFDLAAHIKPQDRSRSARCGCGRCAASAPASPRARPASIQQSDECPRPSRDRAPPPCPRRSRAPAAIASSAARSSAAFTFGQDSGRAERRCMRLAGGNSPVQAAASQKQSTAATLRTPRRAARESGPTTSSRIVVRSTLIQAYLGDLISILFRRCLSRGISLPVLSVSRPAAA